MRKIVVSSYGFCPEINENTEIKVYFAEVPILGRINPGYKKTRYVCDYAFTHSCKTAGNSGLGCPLYSECPKP